ncbi:unnamed protein product [Trypanosoma congolense IL3000]|uniref:WGS project CAEQ00000000 data, annotated contig 594 n=1 Tax=Trypanosoma congolense (strain IL3000) TaxID=1068625 RepID=F9WH49_TRYCI|nr:unnamed protein product [Trypanosoma congolense IL3000]
MTSSWVAEEISKQLQSVLEEAARHFVGGGSISCSLALLPDAFLHGMPHSWGTAEIINQPQGGVCELVVGIDTDLLKKSLKDFLCGFQHMEGELEGSLPPVATVAKRLSRAALSLLLLLMPAHGSLWNELRSRIKRTRTIGNGGDYPIIVQEFLFTSLLLTFHHKTQEVWVYRLWVVQQLLSADEADVQVLNRHDQAVLLEAADKHHMNYNAWNYRRQAFDLLIATVESRGENQTGTLVAPLLQREVDIVLRFFESHNGDCSAVSYLIFLLHKSEAVGNGTSRGSRISSGCKGSRNGVGCTDSLANAVWANLLAATARELRRHYDKGHEVVWILRLALVQWALRTLPACGWTLQDEIDFATTYMELPVSHEDLDGLAVAWSAGSGCASWTQLHAARYGIELFKLIAAAQTRCLVCSEG